MSKSCHSPEGRCTVASKRTNSPVAAFATDFPHRFRRSRRTRKPGRVPERPPHHVVARVVGELQRGAIGLQQRSVRRQQPDIFVRAVVDGAQALPGFPGALRRPASAPLRRGCRSTVRLPRGIALDRANQQSRGTLVELSPVPRTPARGPRAGTRVPACDRPSVPGTGSQWFLPSSSSRDARP